MTKYLLILPV